MKFITLLTLGAVVALSGCVVYPVGHRYQDRDDPGWYRDGHRHDHWRDDRYRDHDHHHDGRADG